MTGDPCGQTSTTGAVFNKIDPPTAFSVLMERSDSSTTHHSLLTIHYSPFTIHHSLFNAVEISV